MDSPKPEVQQKAGALVEHLDYVERFVEQSISKNTRRAYRADWQAFVDWCETAGVEPLPAVPATVASYIGAMARGETRESGEPYAAGTIARRMTTIRLVHGARECDDPTDHELVRKTWRGIRRDEAVDVEQEGCQPLLTDQVRRMVDAVGQDGLKAVRDRAIILVGFATAMRRSELAELEAGDVEFRAEGALFRVRRSKTDQVGRGHTPTVHYGQDCCAVDALEQWFERAAIDDGPVFWSVDRWGNLREPGLSGRAINEVVKSAADAAGMNSDRIGAHSLRAGHVTQRKIAGEPDGAIMDQTGHSSETAMRQYDRAAKEFRHDVSESLGL